MIISKLLDNTAEAREASKSALVYAYCDYRERSSQTPGEFLRSIAKQILKLSTNEDAGLPTEVVSLYKAFIERGTVPLISDIKVLLKKLCTGFHRVYIVIDALDELSEIEDTAAQFALDILALGTNIKLLCTSRFSMTFMRTFKGIERCVRLEISAPKDDIALFVKSQVQREPRLSRHIRLDAKLGEQVIEVITNECRGM